MNVCYAIIETRSFYGPRTEIKTETSLVMDDMGLHHLSFASRQETRAWIRRLESRKDYAQRKEGRPATYVVTEVGSESFLHAYERAVGVEWSLSASF